MFLGSVILSGRVAYLNGLLLMMFNLVLGGSSRGSGTVRGGWRSSIEALWVGAHHHVLDDLIRRIGGGRAKCRLANVSAALLYALLNRRRILLHLENGGSLFYP